MGDQPNLLQAGLDAMRVQAEHDALDRISADADEAARHALDDYAADDWLDVQLAEGLLLAARALRQAGRQPSAAVVDAMERCTAAHREWAEAEAAEMAAALSPSPADASAEAPVEAPSTDDRIRLKVGLGDIVKGVLQVRRS